MLPTEYFAKMIKHLRTYEEIVLYASILKVDEAEEAGVVTFLASEFQRESFSYPYSVPPFDSEAAIWAAKTIYIAAQLLLYRENNAAELETLLPHFPGAVTASAALSADLCLRFVPDMILQLKAIDSEDRLINVLERLLKRWHYSGISYLRSLESLDFTFLTENDCLCLLYADRVIAFRNLKLARQPLLGKMIRAALGDLGNIYWSDFELETNL